MAYAYNPLGSLKTCSFSGAGWRTWDSALWTGLTVTAGPRTGASSEVVPSTRSAGNPERITTQLEVLCFVYLVTSIAFFFFFNLEVNAREKPATKSLCPSCLVGESSLVGACILGWAERIGLPNSGKVLLIPMPPPPFNFTHPGLFCGSCCFASSPSLTPSPISTPPSVNTAQPEPALDAPGSHEVTAVWSPALAGRGGLEAPQTARPAPGHEKPTLCTGVNPRGRQGKVLPALQVRPLLPWVSASGWGRSGQAQRRQLHARAREAAARGAAAHALQPP